MVIGTHNLGKQAELRALLDGLGLELVTLPELGLELEVPEPGPDYATHARAKALAYARASSLWAVSDDSGLEVDALGGAPGVHSARFAGPDATYSDNCARVLERLAGTVPEDRTARFATVAIACWPDGREVVAIGTVEGVVTDSPRGEGGFGYDPVFVPVEGDGRTFAEMSPADKHAISHRGRAFRTLAEGLCLLAEVGDC